MRAKLRKRRHSPAIAAGVAENNNITSKPGTDIPVYGKTYQTENGGAVLEIVDSGKSAIEIERKNDMVKVVIDQKEVWVSKDSVN